MNLPLRNSRIKLPLGQVFWREVGQGPILIFLHGSWNDGSQWLPVIEQLSQNYHCFALDLLGFGESERPNLHYSIQLEVECLFQYLEALHISEVYLVGHSLGGWIAASYALKHFENVSGLVLIAPEGVQVQGKRLGGGWKRWLLGRPPIAYIILQILYPLARLFGRHKPIEQALKWRKQILSSPTAYKLLFKRRRAEIQAELVQDQLEWLNVPTVILQGAKDDPDAIAQAQVYATQIPKAHLQMVELGDNNLPEALPGLLAGHIHDFVNRVEGLKVEG
ncbi:alpha/beta hydrolase [Allocoleopsis sp.]|uniref:alpha/beta fold hydrolase n=1 Tax=Allocoleopsis sp. TaxID=3088169 RepID=UPI002FCECC49